MVPAVTREAVASVAVLAAAAVLADKVPETCWEARATLAETVGLVQREDAAGLVDGAVREVVAAAVSNCLFAGHFI